jgi:hypothetical protein
VSDEPRKCASNTRGKPFAHGNPGKAKGTRHRATRAIEALLEGDVEALTRKAIEKALDGDVTALRLCLDRLAPPRKDNPVRFTLPRIQSAADAAEAMSAIIGATAAGELTPTEANEIGRLVESFVRALETTELEKRITALEAERKQ